MFRRWEVVFVVLGLIGTAGEQPAWGGDAYTFADLGALGPSGASSDGLAVNADGQVAGWTNVNINNGVRQAFLYSGGAMTGLGTFGGSNSYGYGINDSGQVAGYSTTSAGTTHAFLYSNGSMTDLGTLGGANSFAYAVNDSGQVAGGALLSSGASRPFLYSGGTMINLGTFGDSEGGTAWDINASGQVVGYVYNSAGYLHAFLDSGGTMTDLGSDLGAIGGSSTSTSAALGINSSGQVVGYYSTSTDAWSRGFLYSNGTMTDLGTLGGPYCYACAINDSGQVVGASTDSTGNTFPFLYKNGTMENLTALDPNSGWQELSVEGINNAGQIVGSGYNSADALHAFLMTPVLLPGDVNGDGKVDVNDLTIVLTNFGKTGMSWSEGAMDGDPTGTVDVNDLTIVLSNFGGTAGAGVAPVPEPSTMALLAVAVGLLAWAGNRDWGEG
jgi:probable HAF family extracellular repeat protein